MTTDLTETALSSNDETNRRRRRRITLGLVGLMLVGGIAGMIAYFTTRPENLEVTQTTAEESLPSLIKAAVIGNGGALLIEYTELLEDKSTLFYYASLKDLDLKTFNSTEVNDNIVLYLTQSSEPTLDDLSSSDNNKGSLLRIGEVNSVTFPYRLPESFLPGNYNGALLIGEKAEAFNNNNIHLEVLVGTSFTIVDPEQNIATPTEKPTFVPTQSPSKSPTLSPTKVPTFNPTKVPTPDPTNIPTPNPTMFPTRTPTISPRPSETDATKLPTLVPTTTNPTLAPTTTNPTFAPSTANPSNQPTSFPTKQPTSTPTNSSSTMAPVPTSPPLPPNLVSNLESQRYNVDGTITIDYVMRFQDGEIVTVPRLRFNIPEVIRAPGPFLYLSKRPFSETSRRGSDLNDEDDIAIDIDEVSGGGFTVEGMFDQILDEIDDVQDLNEFVNGSWIVWCRPFGIWLGGGPISIAA